MPRIYIGIGSNIDRKKNIRSALRALGARYGPLALSRMYESKAVGFEGENFYNLVAGFSTEKTLEELGGFIGDLEEKHGRRRGEARYGPRTLDIDLLMYGDVIRHDEDFDIPRPEITQHAYVLLPLSEIAPDLPHPETGRTCKEMWEQLKDSMQKLWPVEF